MGRISWQDNWIRILSLLLAFILWVYVSSEQNPLREKVLTVPLEVDGPPKGYIIAGGLPENVKVKVEGDRNLLSRVSPSDIRAVVSVPGDKTGEVTLPVQVTATPGLRATQVLPAEVTVVVDRLIEREVPVAVSLRGSPAQGYTALAPVCRPASVVVKGPSRVVEEVGQVAAVVDIQGAAKDVELDVQVSAGRQGLALSPAAVHVLVPVVGAAGALTSKVVAVVPQTAGTPAAGWEIKRLTSNPPTVQVYGPADVLASVTSIKTEVVDVQGASSTTSKEVGLVLPQGAVAVQPNRVKVEVEISKVGEAGQQAGKST